MAVFGARWVSSAMSKVPQLVSTTAVSSSPFFTVCFGALKLTFLGCGRFDFLRSRSALLEPEPSPPLRPIRIAATITDRDQGEDAEDDQPRSTWSASLRCPSSSHHAAAKPSWNDRCMSEQSTPPSAPILAVGRAVNNVAARAPWLWPLLRARCVATSPSWRRLGRPHRRRRSRAPRAARRRRPPRLPRPGADPRRRLRDGEGTLFLAREFPQARVRGSRPLRGDDPRGRRQGRARPRGPGRLQGRRRLLAPLCRGLLRPRRPAQHAAVLRRARAGPAPRRPGDRRRQLGRRRRRSTPARSLLRWSSSSTGSSRSRSATPARGTFYVARAVRERD